MKNNIILGLLVTLVLLTSIIPASTETINGSALYPIRENGIWGYMNRQGETVIEPQWTAVWPFEGNTALVSIDENNMLYGIINRRAEWLLEPEYYIYPMDYLGRTPEIGHGLYAVWKDGQMGYFDMDTGFFSGLKWPEVWHAYTESPLLAVTDPKTDATGYVDRTSGEQVIPGLYHTFYPGLFYEGIAVVYYEYEESYEDNNTSAFMINEAGETISLPNGIKAVDNACAACGRVAIKDLDGLVGYADLEGKVVISPQYLSGGDFCEERAAVQTAKDEWAIIGLNGEYILDHLTARPSDYNSGVVAAKQNGMVACFDAEGNLLPNRLPEMMDAGDGLVWMPVGGAWCLADAEGNMLSEPIQLDYPAFADDAVDFSNDLQPVGDGLGHWGYMNRQGEITIACQYGSAEQFRDGLALVEKNGKLQYIDHEGNVVWKEK